jgi:hypothetical protein
MLEGGLRSPSLPSLMSGKTSGTDSFPGPPIPTKAATNSPDDASVRQLGANIAPRTTTTPGLSTGRATMYHSYFAIYPFPPPRRFLACHTHPAKPNQMAGQPAPATRPYPYTLRAGRPERNEAETSRGISTFEVFVGHVRASPVQSPIHNSDKRKIGSPNKRLRSAPWRSLVLEVSQFHSLVRP